MKDLTDDKIEFMTEYINNNTNEFRPSSTPSIVFGTFILWTCWLFFNGGSSFAIVNIERRHSPQKVMMNTFVAAGVSGIVAVFSKPHLIGTYSSLN